MSPLERGRIRAQSKKARARARLQAKVRAQVFERDGDRCRLAAGGEVVVHGELVGIPPCFGHLTPHHIVKTSQRTADTVDNEVALCSSHNDWLEACPRAVAVALGLAERAKHDISQVRACPAKLIHGGPGSWGCTLLVHHEGRHEAWGTSQSRPIVVWDDTNPGHRA